MKQENTFFRYKLKYVFVIAIILSISYTLVGNFRVMKLNFLPLTSVDKNLSLMPWTFWIYTSYFFYLIASALSMPNREHFARLYKSFLLMVSIHIIVFILYPTGYPRPSYVPGKNISSLLGNLLYKLDAPTNCLPSLHVSLTFIAAFAVSKAYRYLTIPMFFWAVAIAISTMTTKQHYFYDVIASGSISLLFYFLFYRKTLNHEQDQGEEKLENAA